MSPAKQLGHSKGDCSVTHNTFRLKVSRLRVGCEFGLGSWSCRTRVRCVGRDPTPEERASVRYRFGSPCGHPQGEKAGTRSAPFAKSAKGGLSCTRWMPGVIYRNCACSSRVPTNTIEQRPQRPSVRSASDVNISSHTRVHSRAPHNPG